MKEYRTKQINFRVTESEYARISEKMQEAGIKHSSAYLRKMAMDGYILKLDLGDLQEIQRLARINSNNINQIAKHSAKLGAGSACGLTQPTPAVPFLLREKEPKAYQRGSVLFDISSRGKSPPQ